MNVLILFQFTIFLQVERHLNLFQVYTNQMREAASTSFWYHFTAVDTVEYDLRRSQPNDPTYHSPLDGDVYQNCNQMASPKATAIPAKNFSFKCNRDVLQPPFYDNVSTPDTYKNCMAHVTSSQAMYTVKSAAIARLQVLNELVVIDSDRALESVKSTLRFVTSAENENFRFPENLKLI